MTTLLELTPGMGCTVLLKNQFQSFPPPVWDPKRLTQAIDAAAAAPWLSVVSDWMSPEQDTGGNQCNAMNGTPWSGHFEDNTRYVPAVHHFHPSVMFLGRVSD